jgi:uroporphyrinogen decarboxylase
MSMTSREIILANLTHSSPDRCGLNFDRNRRDDFLGGGIGPSLTFKEKRWVEGEMEYYNDEWGNVWRRMREGCQSGEVFQPAIPDWSVLPNLKLPDYDDPRRYVEVRRRFAEPTDKFKMFFVPGWIFATSRYLRKMEIYFMDLIEYRNEIECLHEKVSDLLVRVIRLAAESGAEGIFYCEDLGVQDRLLMSPDMWRDVFRKHYLKLTGAAHENGLRVFMHSCGYNWLLVDDLIAAGIDCFQFDQPAAYDLPALAAKLREKKVALWSPIDIQKVLPTGDRALIESEAERMVRTFKGCLIMKNYPDLPGIGVKPEWDEWGYQAVLKATGVT